MIKAIKLNASGSSTNIYGLVEFSKRPFRQDFPSEKCEVACVNQVNKDKIVSELKSIPGLKGIMVCEDGDNGEGSDILLYYGAEEGFHPELDQAIHRLEEGGLPKDRRKAPCFSYGDIRRALSCVMWELAV